MSGNHKKLTLISISSKLEHEFLQYYRRLRMVGEVDEEMDAIDCALNKNGGMFYNLLSNIQFDLNKIQGGIRDPLYQYDTWT